MEFLKTEQSDGIDLAELRASAMKSSLVAIGRFDENRVRNRFLETFEPRDTFKVIEKGELLGFYVVREKEDHHFLDHLYIKASHQNRNLGKAIIEKVIADAKANDLPVRLGALRGSRANHFYSKNGFSKTHEDEFDIYYEYSVHN
jgi:GNAT superfamily N-acetyltransferase